MSGDPTLLRRLMSSVDATEHIEDTRRKLDAILRACDLLLRLDDLRTRQMSALTDALSAAIDRLAAKVAESSNAEVALSELQSQKATLEQAFNDLKAQFDEHTASIQAAIDKANSVVPPPAEPPVA